MDLIEIVVTVCAVLQPTTCEERHLQFSWQGSQRQCMMAAQPYIAQWINEHPNWMAVRWRCDYPGTRERADARGPARAA